MDGKTSHAAQCTKSRALTKMIDLIIEIEWSEQQCVIIKELLRSERPKQHMVTIGVNQSLSNNAMYEHICMENIKKLYKYDGKYN